MSELEGYIRQLEEGLGETISKIDEIPEAYPDEACGHICARVAPSGTP